MNEYIIELRGRLLRALIAYFVFFAVMLPFMQQVFARVSQGLLHSQHPPQFIAQTISSTFTVPLKLIAVCALFLAAPYIIWQLWAFIKPALYKQERKLVAPLLLIAITLFYSGALFAYAVVCPLALKFFMLLTPAGVLYLPDISNYLSFILSMVVVFAICFEIPIASLLLIRLKILSKARLKRLRPYIVIIAFVVGMVLTPPDVISQIMLAIPMWLLFELGLVLDMVLPGRSAI